MNSDMFGPGNETELFLLSITGNCEMFFNTLIQNHKKHLYLSLPDQEQLSHQNHLLFLALTLNG